MAQVALVTGASSGIGAEFAKQLSKSGYEVILVARRSRPARAARVRAVGPGARDLLRSGQRRRLPAGKVGALGLQVDVLVNNAGFGTHGRFTGIDAEREAEEVRLNCEALVTLTHAFLPGMVERGRGGVITVASTAGMQPIPYEATYSASKAFARTFSDASERRASRHRREALSA